MSKSKIVFLAVLATIIALSVLFAITRVALVLSTVFIFIGIVAIVYFVATLWSRK